MPARRPTTVVGRVRMLRIARHVFDGGELTARWIMRNCGVVESVARRDMALVAMYLPVENVTRPRQCNYLRAKRLRLPTT